MSDYQATRSKCPYAEPLDYCLIYADSAESIGLVGMGTIDGQARPGESFEQVPGHRGLPERPMLARFYHCQGVAISGLTLMGAGSWCMHFAHSRNLKLHRVNVFNQIQDGFNIQSCEDISISDCHLKCGDDAIALTTDDAHSPLKNCVVTNCLLSSRWAGVRLGPLSRGNFENIAIANCVFYDCYGGGIKLGMFEGAEIRDMIISNLVMQNVTAPISLFLSRLPPIGLEKAEPAPIGRIHHVQFENIRAVVADKAGPPWYGDKQMGEGPDQGSAVFIHGHPGHNIEDITLSNLAFTFPGGGSSELAVRRDMPDFDAIPKVGVWPDHHRAWGGIPAYGLYARHVNELTLNNLHFDLATPDRRSAIFLQEVREVELAACRLKSDGNAAVTLKDARQVFVQGCRGEGEAESFMRVEGSSSRAIGMVGNDFRNRPHAVQVGDGVGKSEVTEVGNLNR
jgi:hypothetical protein